MAVITILHVSDVNFGERDRLGLQPEICNRLLEKAYQQGGLIGFSPDLCIFSGDLTFQGGEEEFKRGGEWLKSLVKPWPNCRLFVVPGNHDIVRPKGDEANVTRQLLRGSDNRGLDRHAYNSRRDSLSKGLGNLLSSFTQWHEDARTEQLPCLVSDWSAQPYGCRWEGLLKDLSVRVIGLNTALLSCEDNEQSKLVADIKYCNQALLNLNPETTLSCVVAHHPWIARDPATGRPEYWFVEWNRKDIETRLLQRTGANLYLHGHVHKAQAESFSNSLGQHLVVLGAGVTHDQTFPLRFAFYRIDCNNQEIQPRTFRYNNSTGAWELDEVLSRSFRAILPRVGPRYRASRPHNNFDDFGYEILAGLYEISKSLDALSKEAYDLIYRPYKSSDFAKAFDEYGRAYGFYIGSHRESLSTKKCMMINNITNLVRHAPRHLGDAGHSSYELLSLLFSQIDEFINCHDALLKYIDDRAILTGKKRDADDYSDLYAKIKATKGECDNAITHVIAFAERYKQLVAQASAAPGDDTEVAKLKGEAKVALDAGQLKRADDLLEEAYQYYSCFISYSSNDEAFAKRLHADLLNSGVRCWFAPHDLPWGAKIQDAIDEAIRVRDKVLLILSKNAIASDWVEDEVSKAFAEERHRDQLVLFPVRIDETVMKTAKPWAVKLRDQRMIGDFRNWTDHDAYQQAFGRVLRDLKATPG